MSARLGKGRFTLDVAGDAPPGDSVRRCRDRDVRRVKLGERTFDDFEQTENDRGKS